MKLPYLQQLPSSESNIIEFKGLNRTITASENEIIDCQNISLKDYPKLTTRKPREVLYSDIANAQAIFKGENFYYVADGGFYVDGVLKFSGLSEGKKSIVLFHDKVCIFPDKKYYDELEDDYGDIGNGEEYPEEGSCPDIDYACVHDNRVFGVKGSTIYACALGNIQDWTTFVDEDGNASDIGAYAVDVASPGDFKGCIEYQNHVVAFKENYQHELYGQRPSNFSVIDISRVGTIENRSIVEANSILYFLNSQGVYRYGGGQPANISLALNESYVSGTMNTNGRFLYLSLYNGEEYSLYVYDTLYQLWAKEDDLNVVDFYQDGNILYCLTEDTVYKFDSGSENIEWYFTLTDLSLIGKTNKKNTMIYASIYAEKDAEIEIYLSIDRGPFELMSRYRYENNIVKKIPISIKNASEVKYKIKGNKYAEVYSIQKVVVGGGSVWR
jgi:hypothetical protein